MAEYIEREALEDFLRKEFSNLGGLINYIRTYVPTADVVEVVRCKDCKHRYVPTRCALWYGTADDTEYFVERGDDKRSAVCFQQGKAELGVYESTELPYAKGRCRQ